MKKSVLVFSSQQQRREIEPRTCTVVYIIHFSLNFSALLAHLNIQPCMFFYISFKDCVIKAIKKNCGRNLYKNEQTKRVNFRACAGYRLGFFKIEIN